MKAFILCRNSTEEQKEKATIEYQIEYAKKYLDLHSEEMGITEHEFYVDEGVSGTVAVEKRPEGARLMRDIRKHKSGILLVYRLDRLARSVKHVLDTYEFLEKHNVGLTSMSEQFDTRTPMGRFFMTLLASIAELERHTIMQRTLDGKKTKAAQGKWVTGIVPYGYSKGADGRLEIVEEEAKNIRKVFDLYLGGMNILELSRYLNAIGMPVCSTGRTKQSLTAKWTAGRLAEMLSIETYTGTYRYLSGDREIVYPVPVIIEPQIYKKVQQKKLENSSRARGGKGRFYILRGLVKCTCGRALTGGSMGSQKRPYYRCQGRKDIGYGVTCSALAVRADEIEDAIWREVVATIKNPESLKKRLREKLNQMYREPDKKPDELAKVESIIQEKQDARGQILSLLAKKIITEAEAEKELTQLAADIKTLTERANTLFDSQAVARDCEAEILNLEMVMDKWKRLVENPDISPETKAEVINTFVSKIEVDTSAQPIIAKTWVKLRSVEMSL